MKSPWLRWLRPRYSLRTLMLLTLVCMTALGITTRDLAQRRAASERDRAIIKKLGATVSAYSVKPDIPAWAKAFVSLGDTPAYQRVVRITFNDPRPPKIRDSEFALVAQLSQLRRLDLGHQLVTEASIPQLAKLPHLEELSLAYTKTAGNLDSLARLTHLRALDVEGCALDRQAWHTIATLTTLRSLNIAGTNANDEVLEALAARLDGLEEITLSGTLVSDEHLRPLVRLPKLGRITSIGNVDFNTRTMRYNVPSQSILPHVQVDCRLGNNDFDSSLRFSRYQTEIRLWPDVRSNPPE